MTMRVLVDAIADESQQEGWTTGKLIEEMMAKNMHRWTPDWALINGARLAMPVVGMFEMACSR